MGQNPRYGSSLSKRESGEGPSMWGWEQVCMKMPAQQCPPPGMALGTGSIRWPEYNFHVELVAGLVVEEESMRGIRQLWGPLNGGAIS